MASKLVFNNHLRTIATAHPSFISALSTVRQKLDESAAYEKEVEEEVDINVEVPDQVEEILHEPEEYWVPDPETGVFVPADAEEPAVSCTTEETVLDDKAFFRPQEDLEPPPPESFSGRDSSAE
ncbi:hypothetical protein M8C21_021579 [Ambrosia artemisiifolia]|uniref:Uncharacterized protein n=1 Tax=Ambrosia artemisiifolia TaxID=4212 RepID=A0AAD5BMH3_AMBAR|nr:hypothetical protein M8C21_021579 [Ambrosia artemisiifolia]